MNSTDKDRRTNSDELFESLFRNAPARARAPEGDEARIRAALHDEWQRITGRRRRLRAGAGIAAVASVLLAIIVFTGVIDQSPGPQLVRGLASVDRLSGRVTAGTRGTGGPVQTIQANEMLMTGSVIATAYNARLALRWLDGESVRLDSNTRILLVSETDIELISGQVYIDSHAEVNTDAGGGSLGINTPFGRVQHIGTQYMTRLAGSDVVISVRQGSVAVTGGKDNAVADAGQQLSVRRSGEFALQPIPGYGENWQWVEEISPGYVLDGRSLADFLEWVSHESGRSLEYASRAAETLARDTVMRGTVDLPPTHALELLLQTSDLVAEVDTGIIKVDRR